MRVRPEPSVDAEHFHAALRYCVERRGELRIAARAAMAAVTPRTCLPIRELSISSSIRREKTDRL
jgi:hypothetical protein